jgi:alkylation response protein AidB-like acyl-CoA dehydrogenase
MDFAFTKEQDLLRTSVSDFSERNIAPKVKEMEETGEVPWDVIGEMGKLGLMAINIPRDFGGAGLGHVERVIVLEEVSKVSAATAFMLSIFHLGTAPIVNHGTDEQKKRILPKMATGDRLGTLAVTEATGGSDPAGIQSTARKEGDTYFLSGRKIFITNAHVANVQVITARTGEGPKGITAFIVEKGMTGFKPGREEHKFGIRGCNTGEVILESCEVPESNILGKEGGGLRVALGAIGNFGRMGMAASGVGLQSACMEAAVKHCKERELYGKPIGKLQGLQWLIAEIFTDYEASRLLTYRAARMIDDGGRADAFISAAKLFSTEAAVRSAKKTVDIHGGYGYMMEYSAQRFYRDAECLIASAGTNEIMKMIIAGTALA